MLHREAPPPYPYSPPPPPPQPSCTPSQQLHRLGTAVSQQQLCQFFCGYLSLADIPGISSIEPPPVPVSSSAPGRGRRCRDRHRGRTQGWRGARWSLRPCPAESPGTGSPAHMLSYKPCKLQPHQPVYIIQRRLTKKSCILNWPQFANQNKVFDFWG